MVAIKNCFTQDVTNNFPNSYWPDTIKIINLQATKAVSRLGSIYEEQIRLHRLARAWIVAKLHWYLLEGKTDTSAP